MSHPVVEAIKSGKAPKAARLAAAKGLLPLPPEDQLEVLSMLVRDGEEEVRASVPEGLSHISTDVLLPFAENTQTRPNLLGFLCTSQVPEPIAEALLLNRSTPDDAIVKFALTTQNPAHIETLTVNQQRLIRNPQLIEAILHNPRRTPEAERRAREIKLEFFEKAFGRQQVGSEAAAQSRGSNADAAATLVQQAPTVAPAVPAAPVAPVAPTPVQAVPEQAPPPPTDLKLSPIGPIAMIQRGTAPRQAKLIAAQGKIPLAPEHVLHAQVLLTNDPDPEIAQAARDGIDEKDAAAFLFIAQDTNAPEEVLAYLMTWRKNTLQLAEALLVNPSVPDASVLEFAKRTTSGSLLEAVSINQQRLIRMPGIIDAIIANPARTPEAERRAMEIRIEFFEKELGVAQIAQEQRRRAEKFKGIIDTPVSEEEFNAIVAEFESEIGVTFSDEEPTQEDATDIFNRLLSSFIESEDTLVNEQGRELNESERASIYQQIAKMSVKERIFAALKGNREVRAILIRDSNKLVSAGVMKNPKLSETEVEAIANIKGVSEEVLRIIAMNRAWMSSYNIMHNVVKNPRTPINFTMQLMNRLQNRDLMNLGKNKGIPDALRQAANRLYTKRKNG